MLRRGCVVVAAITLLWAFAVSVTGGFVLEAGPVRFSSRTPRNPLLLTVVACLVGWALDRKSGRRHSQWSDEVVWLAAAVGSAVPDVVRRHVTPRLLAAGLAMVIVLSGLAFGAHVVGGSDSYGYVSQARMWATGALETPQPLLDDLPAGVPQESLVPLAYRLNPDRTSLVPVYAPGLPMLMAVFERLGGQQAVYMVVPLLAGLAVWTTYAIGAALVGEWGGLIAALLLATSPAFLFQVLVPPMSDIPAATWWNVALLLVWRPGRRAAFGAGVATAAAILTRPNLVPLAVIPGAVLLLALRSADGRPAAVQRLSLFAAPSIGACLAVAQLNTYWYGSPLSSGYGALAGELFQWTYFWPNITEYTTWILQSQGLLSLLCVVGVVALWQRLPSRDDRRLLVLHLWLAVAVYACYAFYRPFGVWWYLRFLLPAFPIFFILVVAGAQAVAARVPQLGRPIVMMLLVAVMTIHTTVFGRSNGAFDPGYEWRYATVGHYIDDELPANAVFFSMLHSGSVRYYSDCLTIRYDWLQPEQFQAMVRHVRSRGFVPFLLLDDAEERDFQQHFRAGRAVPSLDRPQVRFQRVSLYRL